MALYQDLRPLLGTFLALVANSVLYTIFSINKPIVRLTPLSLSLALASSLSLSRSLVLVLMSLESCSVLISILTTNI